MFHAVQPNYTNCSGLLRRPRHGLEIKPGPYGYRERGSRYRWPQENAWLSRAVPPQALSRLHRRNRSPAFAGTPGSGGLLGVIKAGAPRINGVEGIGDRMRLF
jgi:hypothetical protein